MTTGVVGIDLGTTNTVVATVQDGEASALSAADGQVLIPSVVSFHPSGNVLVGAEAKARRKIDASSTIYSVKRLIGRSWSSDEVRQARERFPFEMREGPGQAALVVARKETYTLPEISAFVLRKAKTVAEQALGRRVDRAVITVPANFNDLQRAATKVAGRVAGLEVMRILNEPTAAALAYGYGKASSERIAVYDFGGGTLDITLLDLSDNVFEVLATAGNTFLGGDDIDYAITERMADELLATHRVDAHADPSVLEQLRNAAEEVKKQLSVDAQTSVEVQELAHAHGGRPVNLSFSMSRAELEQLMNPILEQTFDVCREALGIAHLEANDFSQVLLVGGSTRIPLVRRRVEEFFGRAPVANLNPDEVVAIGAAIQANALTGTEKRRSTMPVPPNPAARANLTGGPKKRESTIPPRIRMKSAPPAETGRPRLRTAPGLMPSSPGARPLPQRSPFVAPPAEGQPTSGVPVTQDRTGARAPAGLGGVTPSSKQPVRTGRGLGPPGPPLPPAGNAPPTGTLAIGDDPTDTEQAVAPTPAGATLENAADHARAALEAADANPSALPLVSPTSATEEPAEFLDAAELEELPAELPDDDDEITLARGQTRTRALPVPAPLPEPGPLTSPPIVARPATHGPPPARPATTQPLAAAAPAAAAPSPQPLTTSPLGMPAPAGNPPIGGLPQPELASPAAAPPTQPLASVELPIPQPVIRQAAEPPLLIDVTPLTLAVETVGGYCDVVIDRNSPIPCENTREFATVSDNQDSVRVRVSQGESQVFAQNTLLGEVVLSGLRRAPRGAVKIEVNFALDASGMLSVYASDTTTGRSVSTRIRLIGLSEVTQVEAMRSRHAALPMA